MKVWEANVGEVMVASSTEEKYFDAIVQLAREMGLVPIAIRKEQAGYVLNSVLIPWMVAAIDLVRDGVSNHEDIDRTWMICNKSKIGPLMMCDMVGMNAAYHIAKGLSASANNRQAGLVAEFLKAEFVDRGKLGAASGEGFYKYPNPSFEKGDFLKPV